MNLRTHLTLWYAAVLMLCVCIAVQPSYDELMLHSPQQSEKHEPKEAWHRFHKVLHDMILEALPLMAIGLIGGWFFTGRALRPLEHVIEAAEKLDEHTLGVRLPQKKCDIEIARLVHVFNNMSARLESSFVRVREFTLHASHELKTPLAVMRGDLETSLNTWDQLTEDQHAKLASQIDEIDRLTRIVDGLFVLVKADAGLFDIAHDALDFEEMVDEMVEAAEILAAPSDIVVTLSQRDAGVVLGDRMRLRQMVLNLADNAIKYNENGGWVDISLRRRNGDLVLTIANSGPGVAEENQGRVFERFYRGPEDGGNMEGCGLGLSIVQWIVHAHCGSIAFHSRPGHTEVEVRLPLHPPGKQNDKIVIPPGGIVSIT